VNVRFCHFAFQFVARGWEAALSGTDRYRKICLQVKRKHLFFINEIYKIKRVCAFACLLPSDFDEGKRRKAPRQFLSGERVHSS
jgi:hypothetical protein